MKRWTLQEDALIRASFVLHPISMPIFEDLVPLKKIITELKMISRNRKITDILFVDDNFTVDTKRIEILCEKIIECKKSGFMSDFKFIAQLRVDALLKSPDKVKKMAREEHVNGKKIIP